MKNFWHFWTDSKNRPAIEAMLGTIFFLLAMVYSFRTFFDDKWIMNQTVFFAYLSAGTALLVTNAVNNNAMDKLPTLSVNQESK